MSIPRMMSGGSSRAKSADSKSIVGGGGSGRKWKKWGATFWAPPPSSFVPPSLSLSLSLSLCVSRRPLPPRLRIEPAKNAQKLSFLPRSQFGPPFVRLAFFLPPLLPDEDGDGDDDDDDALLRQSAVARGGEVEGFFAQQPVLCCALL